MAHPDRPVRAFRDDHRPEIAGYELAEVIGRGAAGVVYRARQTAVDREVALKVLHDHLKDNPRLVRRMQREARTTARMAHPHVVSAVDMGEVDGRFWFAMEFVDGPSLALRLRQEGRLKEREALRLFIPLCEALEHLFEHGVVHRDIKPANILIDARGGARLADLGLAFADDDPSITGQGGTLGTPHYISPEQAVDPTGADVRSDIWSFGATLYHTVCGRPPFSGESAAEILSGVLYERIQDPSELEPTLSRRLSLVLRKCLTRDPEGRYQVPRELLLDLERVRERRAPKIRRRALDPVGSRYDRRPFAWALAAVAGVVLVVAGSLLFRAFAPGEEPGDPVAAAPPPLAPLEELLVRVDAGDLPAALLAAFSDLQDELPPEYETRAAEIGSVLRDHLRRRVRSIRDQMRARLSRSMQERDFAAGTRLLDEELEKELLSQTGLPSSELAAHGVDIAPWRGQLVGELRSSMEAVRNEIEGKVAEFLERTLVEARDLAENRQDWRRAFELVQYRSPEEILARVGYGDFEFPPDVLDELVSPVRIPFDLARQRLTDSWIVVDRELRSFVERRADTLEARLEAGPVRIAAGAQLEEDFEAELFDRGLNRARMPDGLPKSSLTTLSKRARELREGEIRLLEVDARRAFDDTERLAGGYMEARAYAKAQALWSEGASDLGSEPRIVGTSWRAELLRRYARRREEARLLALFLQHVSERILALDGRTTSFLVGRVDVPEVRIEAGVDPLTEGFHVSGSGLEEKQDLRTLPASQMERFAGFGDGRGVNPEERLMLALFRYYEGRNQLASQALESGPAPDSGPGFEVALSLGSRLAAAAESEDQRMHVRAEEAQRRLDIVFDEGRQVSHPEQVIALVHELLSDYGEVPEVRHRRLALAELRDRLGSPGKEEPGDPFEERFGAASLHYPARDEVRMIFDFQGPEVGAWDLGEWSLDNVGAVLTDDVGSWNELVQRRGPRLRLREPFRPDPELELELVIEQLASSGPPQLFWVSLAGFQIAFAGPGLPGTRRDARYLVGDEAPEAFLERLKGGGGEGDPKLLQPGITHRIKIRAHRRAGRLEVVLDGREVIDARNLHPDLESRSIELRSFEPVRLVRAELAGGR